MKQQQLYIATLLGTIVFTLMNAAALYQQHVDHGNVHQQQRQVEEGVSQGIQIGSDFYSHSVDPSRRSLEEVQEDASFPSQQQQQQQQQQDIQYNQDNDNDNDNSGRQYPKTLVGIISSDDFNGAAYRKRHRALFGIWNDTRVCSLAQWKEIPEHLQRQPTSKSCQLIYTFIIGGRKKDPMAPTEIVDNSTQLLVDKPIKGYKQDVNRDDVTLLNIRENMNEGKSQTFMYFASLMLEEYHLNYAMKLDADSMLHLHDYFRFAHGHLPPAPYNVNLFAGAMRDKAYWPKQTDPTALNRLESFWGNEFEGVHLYLAGQSYLLSLDLCRFVAQEAPYSKIRIGQGGYLEGHEDHDLSAMVFHSPTPIHLLTIGKSQRFWEHPVKGQRRWERIVKRETARMARTKFEGRILRIY